MFSFIGVKIAQKNKQTLKNYLFFSSSALQNPLYNSVDSKFVKRGNLIWRNIYQNNIFDFITQAEEKRRIFVSISFVHPTQSPLHFSDSKFMQLTTLTFYQLEQFF